MVSVRCDRCGSAAPRTGGLCPVCHAVVDGRALAVALDGPTTDDMSLPARDTDPSSDDDLDLVEAEPLDDDGFNGPTVAIAMPQMAVSSPAGRDYDALDAPTEPIASRLRAPLLIELDFPVSSETRQSAVHGFGDLPSTGPALGDFDHQPSTDAAPHHDPFAPRLTAPIHHNGIFRSATDAVILGDAGDIAGSLLVEQPAADMNGLDGIDDDSPEGFLTEPTDAKRRVVVPVQVYIGRDIAEALTPEIVLQVKDGVDVNWLPLSPFERFVVKEFDGVRPLARVQTRLQFGNESTPLLKRQDVESSKLFDRAAVEIKLTVALLLDKQVLAPVGVALKQTSAPGAVAQVLAPADQPFHNPKDHTASAATPRKPHSLLASMLDEADDDDVPTKSAGSIHDEATMLLVGGAGASPDPRQGAWLHAQALQCITAGDVARAWQLACLACEADPDNTRYRATLDRWADVVATTGSEDARLYAMAIRRESLGDKVGAMAALRQAIAFNDKNAGAWNRLGLLLITLDKDLDAAGIAFERATLLAPDDATFRNNHDKAVEAADRRRLGGVQRTTKR
jgi:Flp pilus assembly protein TadD